MLAAVAVVVAAVLVLEGGLTAPEMQQDAAQLEQVTLAPSVQELWFVADWKETSSSPEQYLEEDHFSRCSIAWPASPSVSDLHQSRHVYKAARKRVDAIN